MEPVNTVPKTKLFLAGNIIKAIVFLIFAVSATVSNFFLEEHFVSGEAISEDNFAKFDYKKENVLPNNAVVRFNSEVTADTKVIAKKSPYIFELKEGQLWGNFAITDAKVNILVGGVVIIPNGAVFDLKFDKDFMDLAVYDGDVYLGFLPEDFKHSQYLDQYSEVFMNRLLVPRGNRVTISMRKVNEEIRPLLYLKLAKEFKYGSISSAEISSEWTVSNQKKDKEFVDGVKQKFKSNVFDVGLSLDEKSYSEKFVLWSEKNLTFVPKKNSKILLDHLFVELDKAIYSSFSAKDQVSDVSKFLASFDDGLALLPPATVNGEDYKNRFNEYLSKLSIFSSADPQYQVFSALLSKKIDQSGDFYEAINLLWLNVYRSLEIDDLSSEKSVDEYYKILDRLIGKEVDPKFYKMFMTYQNQLFDNLLFRYELFYKDGYFSIKDVYENELLKIYSKKDLAELKQDFISKKIDFLKRLKKYFFEEKIDVTEAKKIYSRLFGEIKKLIPEDTSSVAVIKLFEAELADFNDFWGYLASPEYQRGAYGPSHKERYEAYLSDRQTIFSFTNVQEDILGDKILKDDSIVDVVDEIEDDLKSNEDLGELEIGKIKDIDQRYVDISAVLGGYPLKAVYDRDNGLLSEVYTYDELISEKPIKLSNLLTVLQSKFADLAKDIPESADGEYDLETDAQRTARFYISKKISDYGFISEIENVSVVDQLNAVYRVEAIKLQGYENIELSFDIVMNGEIVTNLFMKIDGNPHLVTGKFTLEELVEVVKAEMDFGQEDVEEPLADDSEKPQKIAR